jgi:hypothetical protein
MGEKIETWRLKDFQKPHGYEVAKPVASPQVPGLLSTAWHC